MDTRRIGSVGEEIACKFLKHHNYSIIDRNWYCYAGELDIVSFIKYRGIVFVEVKFVTVPTIFPEELFTQAKVRHLLRTINRYLIENPKIYNWSLDLICLSKKYDDKMVINHYKDVLADVSPVSRY